MPPPITPDGPTDPPPPDGEGGTAPDYVRVLFTDETLPAPKGEISKALMRDPLQQQRKNAQALFTFLQEEANHLRLNIGTTPLTAMMIIPESCSIKILYGLGYSAPAIGDSTPLDNKFLALHGEGSQAVGPPELAIFP